MIRTKLISLLLFLFLLPLQSMPTQVLPPGAVRSITCRDGYYLQAYSEIVDMLEGRKPLSIKRAVFLAEWAFLEGKLDYEKDFCEPIRKDVDFIRRFMAVNGYDQYKTGKQMAILEFFIHPYSGNRYKPFEYNFKGDITDGDYYRQLVFPVLKTHVGQCRSLPWLFKIYAEELGAKVSLAHAPAHAFLMYEDEDDLYPEDWVCVELTSQSIVPLWAKRKFDDPDISDSAVSVGTYYTPLTDKQTVACQLTDMLFGYRQKYHTFDDFMGACAEKSLQYYKMNPTAYVFTINSYKMKLLLYVQGNGYRRDSHTDKLDAIIDNYMNDLAATHWVQPTEEREKQIAKTKEEHEARIKNVTHIDVSEWQTKRQVKFIPSEQK